MGKNKKKTGQAPKAQEEPKKEAQEPPKEEGKAEKVQEKKPKIDEEKPQDDKKQIEKSDEKTADVEEPVQDAEEILEEPKLVNITIVDLNKRKINLKMVQHELILEVREFLAENVFTCFFTNYYLEHLGNQLSDYSDLSQLDLESDPCIYMRPKLYDEKSGRFHIKKVNDILSAPQVLNAQQNTPEEDKLNEIVENGKKNGLSEEDVAAKQQEVFNEMQAQQEEKQKSLYENFMKIIQNDQGKQYIQPNKSSSYPSSTGSKPDTAQVTGEQHVLNQIYETTIEKQMNKDMYAKTVESIQFSTFNPVTPARKLTGDLFYLTVKTLDAGEKGITCCVNGFYLNDNVEKGVFSPGPSTKKNQAGSGNGAFSYTLIGCLNQISPCFGKNLQKYLSQILNTEQYFLTKPNIPVYHWACFDDKKQSCDQNFMSEVVNPLYGLDPKGIRDWNEEYQVVKDFPKENVPQRAQRDRAVQKIYNDFLNAASEGAVAIVKGNLTPLNPNEQKKQQVFVYNYIFFSFALDVAENFKDLSTLESNPSWTQANHDMTGLRNLQLLEVEGLNYLATTVVNYRGHRIICQSIIPGILNNSELASLAEYGTVDDQKTIQANEEFHTMMTKVAEYMNIQTNKVMDGEGKEIEIAGCVEIKGIRGTDKRKYIVDLQGMTPRDANWEGDENHTCLLRQELMLLYQRSKQMEVIREKMGQYEKEQEVEKTQKMPKIEEGAEATEEQKKEILKLKAEFDLKKVQKFNELQKEAENIKFNTNVFKNVKLAMSPEKLKEEEDKVKDVAKYLKEKAITNMIARLEQNSCEGMPSDSSTLKDFLHSNGINMRYLGYLAEQVKENKKLGYFKYLLEREVVIRCAKHILNQYIRDNEYSELLGAVIAHLLNCLLAPKEFLKRLDEGAVTYETDTVKKVADEQQQEFRLDSKNDSKVQDVPTISKKEKLRQKRAKAQEVDAKGDNVNSKDKEQETNSFTGDVAELLFKSPYDDFTFEAEEIFAEPSVAMNVVQCETPEVLTITPKKLYQQIRDLAEKRYKYSELPKKLAQLKMLEKPANKMSVLRDLCLSLGLVINFSDNKQFIFENDVQKLKEMLSQQISQKKAKIDKKKSRARQQNPETIILPDEELFVYSNLPFSPQDIADFFPILKSLPLQNRDVQSFMQEANLAQKQEQWDRAFDLYGQTINLLLQISGAMNHDVAQCISKMAGIQFKMGDFLQAIELQSKSIIISEKLLGCDHPSVAYHYSNLALYYHTCQYHTKGFEYMHKSLKILQVVCGENHPDLASIYLNLGLMYQDCENLNAAIDCYMDSLYRSIDLYGDTHNQVATCYQAIAHAYYLLSDCRLALEYQEKSHIIVKQLNNPSSPIVLQSQRQLDQFMQQSIQQEKQKQAQKQSMGHGSGQRQIGQNKPKLSEQEKEELSKKQKIEQYVKSLAEGNIGQVQRQRAKAQSQKAGFLEQLEKQMRMKQYQEFLQKQATQVPHGTSKGMSAAQWQQMQQAAAAAQQKKAQETQKGEDVKDEPQAETPLARAIQSAQQKKDAEKEQEENKPQVTEKSESVSTNTENTNDTKPSQSNNKKGKKSKK